MCIICDISDISILINLTELNCSDCPLLTSIPYTLINLKSLNCSDCPLLTSIPSTLVNLKSLNCSDCPLLTSIPNTLINLIGLHCSDCPLLTSIPDTLVNLIYLDCSGNRLITTVPFILRTYNPRIHIYYDDCPWINYNKDKNIRKLITLQRFVKKNIKYWIFSKWIKSKEGVEWIYHPDNIGGIIAKKSIEKLFLI
jgi:hypothetical protein